MPVVRWLATGTGGVMSCGAGGEAGGCQGRRRGAVALMASFRRSRFRRDVCGERRDAGGDVWKRV